jgi:ABC-type proline/glycine betaine transport system ATPase subunit
MDADILLMDEPFSALDPLIRQGLQDELLELQRKLSKTIVFVSHDLDEALKLGSRIAIMKDGKIIQYSKPEEIVLNPADDYVRTFVAHTNPLNVLCGRSLMRTLDNCKRVNGSVCIDPGDDSWIDLAKATPSRVYARGRRGTEFAALAARAGRGRTGPRPDAGGQQHRHARCVADSLPDRQQTGAARQSAKWWGFWGIRSCITRCWARIWVRRRPSPQPCGSGLARDLTE